MKTLIRICLLAVLVLTYPRVGAAEPLLNPKQVWADYDPNKGDFKEEIVKQETKDGLYYRESYISAYVLGEEVRVYTLYQVKDGARKAPGLLNVHGWMGAPSINKEYVADGWAVMSYDYCGKNGNRVHYTKYPDKLFNIHNPKVAMANWNNLSNIQFKPKGGADITKILFAHFKWTAP